MAGYLRGGRERPITHTPPCVSLREECKTGDTPAVNTPRYTPRPAVSHLHSTRRRPTAVWCRNFVGCGRKLVSRVCWVSHVRAASGAGVCRVSLRLASRRSWG